MNSWSLIVFLIFQVAYVDHPQQLSVAKEQIQFIFDLVKKHKDQPELAKKICEQKHHIPGDYFVYN